MLTNRVLMGSAVVVAMAFFHGAAAGAPLPAPVQARSSDACSAPIRQQLGTVLPQMSATDEEKLCNDLEQPATSSVQSTGGTLAIYRDQWYRDEQTAMAPVPTTGGVDTTCVARVRQELGTAWPRMGSADEARLCSSFEKVADTVPTTGGSGDLTSGLATLDNPNNQWIGPETVSAALGQMAAVSPLDNPNSQWIGPETVSAALGQQSDSFPTTGGSGDLKYGPPGR